MLNKHQMLLFLVISAIAIFILSTFLTVSVGSKVEEAERAAQKHLGTTITVEDKTLVIVDYSLINGTYTLSDGTIVSRLIVEKDE